MSNTTARKTAQTKPEGEADFDAPALTPTQKVLLEVEAERKAQDERWGEQNHPLGGGKNPAAAREVYAQKAEGWKAINDDRVEADTMGWDSIVLEEVFEALAEEDPQVAREEWVQIAAVAVAAIERIERLDEGA